jgi:transcriptional antiterminator RfaH
MKIPNPGLDVVTEDKSISDPNWYLVFCKPRQEAVAETHLVRQGYRVYLPRIRIRGRRRGQWLDLIEALFPRYLFIHLDPRQRSTASVRSTRGVIGLVRFGGHMAIVPNDTIEGLRAREGELLALHEDPRMRLLPGDQIRIVDGPLSGLDGVFTQGDGKHRVMVLLDLLGQVNKVSMDRDWIIRAA